MPNKFDLSDPTCRYRLIIAALSLALCICVIALIVVSVKLSRTDKPAVEDTTRPAETTADPLETTARPIDFTTAPPEETTAPITGFIAVPVTSGDASRGNLILVDDTHAFNDASMKTTVIWGNKTSSYQVPNTTIEISEDVLPALNALMDACAQATSVSKMQVYGTLSAEVLDTLTGASFRVNYYDGNTYKFDDTKYKAASDWLTANAADYGFIQRYPNDKNLKNVFRYVGVANAKAMKAANLDLETYLATAKAHTYADPYKVNVGDATYLVYYTAATADATTELRVPETRRAYEYSGDNMGGFVVTVTVDAPAQE